MGTHQYFKGIQPTTETMKTRGTYHLKEYLGNWGSNKQVVWYPLTVAGESSHVEVCRTRTLEGKESIMNGTTLGKSGMGVILTNPDKYIYVSNLQSTNQSWLPRLPQHFIGCSFRFFGRNLVSLIII